MKRLSALLAAALLASSLFEANSAVLVTYSFATNLSPTSSGVGLSATAFSGTGTARSTNSYAYQFPQAANSGYMQFTLTATGGNVLDLTDISFNYDFLQSSGAQATVQGTIALEYSLDNFASSTQIQSFIEPSGTVVSGGNTVFTPSGTLSLAGIPDSSSISFRFVLSNNGSLNTANYRYGIDDVVINGNVVAVPEPSTVFLSFLGLGFITFRFLRQNPIKSAS